MFNPLVFIKTIVDMVADSPASVLVQDGMMLNPAPAQHNLWKLENDDYPHPIQTNERRIPEEEPKQGQFGILSAWGWGLNPEPDICHTRTPY